MASFSNLPAEGCNKIYDLALVMLKPIQVGPCRCGLSLNDELLYLLPKEPALPGAIKRIRIAASRSSSEAMRPSPIGAYIWLNGSID